MYDTYMLPEVKISICRLRTTDKKTKLLNLGTGFKAYSMCIRRKVLRLVTQTEVKKVQKILAYSCAVQ